MENQHPITPPPELVQQWETDWHCSGNTDGNGFTSFVVTTAAQWGADQELEACCEWLDSAKEWNTRIELRAARRPKPPSLKEQAYAALDAYIYGNPDHSDKQNTYNIIRRALEQLND